MKELRAVVSDEEFATLEHLAQDLGLSLEELMKRSLAAYLAQAKAESTFEPIGFGMWADRPGMQRGEVGGRVTAPGMDPVMVLDTDVFIDHFRGQETATTYIHSLPSDERATTDITVMELYKGAANQQELATILRFLTRNRVTRLPVSTTSPRLMSKVPAQAPRGSLDGSPRPPHPSLVVPGSLRGNVGQLPVSAPGGGALPPHDGRTRCGFLPSLGASGLRLPGALEAG